MFWLTWYAAAHSAHEVHVRSSVRYGLGDKWAVCRILRKRGFYRLEVFKINASDPKWVNDSLIEDSVMQVCDTFGNLVEPILKRGHFYHAVWFADTPKPYSICHSTTYTHAHWCHTSTTDYSRFVLTATYLLMLFLFWSRILWKQAIAHSIAD